MKKIVSVSMGSGIYRHIEVPDKTTVEQFVNYALLAFSLQDDVEDVMVQGYSPDTEWISIGDKFEIVLNEEYLLKCKVLRETERDDEAVYIVKESGQIKSQRRKKTVLFTKNGLHIKLESMGIDFSVYSLIKQYLCAYSTLYGIIPLKDGYRIFDRHNPGTLTFEQFEQLVKINALDEEAQSQDTYSEIKDGYIVGCADDLNELRRCQKGKSLYIPSREKLLSLVDYDAPEGTKYEERICEFLSDDLRISDVESILRELLGFIRSGYEMSDTMDQLPDLGIDFKNQRQMSTFVQLYQDLHNHTRIPENRGHTPAEIAVRMPEGIKPEISFGPNILKAIGDGIMDGHELIEKIENKGFKIAAETKANVGRNDPCPCGSGKKYKNCCGKAN